MTQDNKVASIGCQKFTDLILNAKTCEEVVAFIDAHCAQQVAAARAKDAETIAAWRNWTLDSNRERDDLRAQLAARIESAEPILYQYRMRGDWYPEPNQGWQEWKDCSKESYADYLKNPHVHNWEYEARALYAAPPQIAQPAPSIPEGYWLAPIEPTIEMVVAIEAEIDDQLNASGMFPGDMQRQDGGNIYEALLRAAPKQNDGGDHE